MRLGPRPDPHPAGRPDSGPAQACLPPTETGAPWPLPREPLASAPGPRWEQTHGTWPQPPGGLPGASVPGQIKGAEGRARGALPVGAACGVAGPWSVGGPLYAGAPPDTGTQPAWPMWSQHHPCRGRQAVWYVPHCLLRGRGEGRGPCPPRACPRGSSDPGAKGHLRGSVLGPVMPLCDSGAGGAPSHPRGRSSRRCSGPTRTAGSAPGLEQVSAQGRGHTHGTACSGGTSGLRGGTGRVTPLPCPRPWGTAGQAPGHSGTHGRAGGPASPGAQPPHGRTGGSARPGVWQSS